MTIRSDPVVQFFEPKISCRICGAIGHSSISCVYASKFCGANMSLEDKQFWSCVDPSEQPY